MSDDRSTDLRLIEVTDRVCELAEQIRTAAMLDGIETLERLDNELQATVGESPMLRQP